MLSLISLLLTGAIVLIFITAALAPLESLGWWAGWYGEKEAPEDGEEPSEEAIEEKSANPATHYLVYLSGIGAITDDSIPQEEIKWLAALNEVVPGTELVTDVFPYSVTNAGLTTERTFSWLWRRVDQMRLKNPMAVAALLVNLRNVFQVLVSADPRYGPIYNYGVAQEIVRALKTHGYVIGSGTPVTMLGWSGGGQISLGTSTFLKGMLKAPIAEISIGGVMADDPGLDSVEQLDHFYGTKDPVQALGGKIYRGRWPISTTSSWNRALAKGKITMNAMGPLTHMGKGNYFDWETIAEDGRPNAQLTIDAVTGVLTARGLLTPPAKTAVTNDLSEVAQTSNKPLSEPPNTLPVKSE